jgi:hypothetical protein
MCVGQGKEGRVHAYTKFCQAIISLNAAVVPAMAISVAEVT